MMKFDQLAVFFLRLQYFRAFKSLRFSFFASLTERCLNQIRDKRRKI